MIALIDNYDSFTYNIAQALGCLGCDPAVFRNDEVSVAKVKSLKPRALIISPGPGRPESAGITLDLISALMGRLPILGVCLGHQAIALSVGAKVERAPRPVHGKASEVFHDGKGIFKGLRNPFSATRYHSLAVPEKSVPNNLTVSAYTQSGEVMGLRSDELMLEGVQFHPESVATFQGSKLFANFLASIKARKLAA